MKTTSFVNVSSSLQNFLKIPQKFSVNMQAFTPDWVSHDGTKTISCSLLNEFQEDQPTAQIFIQMGQDLLREERVFQIYHNLDSQYQTFVFGHLHR
jgi:hypothetical protein